MALLPPPTNTDLQVRKKDGTTLTGAILKKYTWTKGYGSFDSKLLGQITYPGKGLDSVMLLGCYVVYPVDGRKYSIINAPSSESFLYVKDNNGLNGNNRYTYEFFAPEYFLTQFEFRDLPLNPTESLYRGGQTSFYLCCSIQELKDRIQKNLDVVNDSLPSGEKWLIQLQGTNYGTQQLDPIQFDKSSIADVLLKIQEVYGLYFFVNYKSVTISGVTYNNIIYIGDISQTMESGKVFDFGQDKGLTSSIRISKKERMINKLYPKGSTRNVPFRYPVIKDEEGNIIEHSYYSERLLPQFTINAIKNNVIQHTYVWRDTFTTYPTVPEFPFFYISTEYPYTSGNEFSWDFFDMRTSKVLISGVSGTFEYYDMDGKYAASFVESGVWKNNKSTRDYKLFPSGNLKKVVLTLKKQIVVVGGISVLYPRANNFPLSGTYVNITDEAVTKQMTIRLILDAYQGRTQINVILQDVIDYILANNSPLRPYPNAALTNDFKNPYDSKTPFVEHVDYEDIHPTIKEVTYSGQRIDIIRANSYGWSETVKIVWSDDWISPGVLKFPYFHAIVDRMGGSANNDVTDAWEAGDFLITPFLIREGNNNYESVFILLNENDYKDSFYVNGVWVADSPNRDFEKYPRWLRGTKNTEVIFRKRVYQSGGNWNVYPNSSSNFVTKQTTYGDEIFFPAIPPNGLIYLTSTKIPFSGYGSSDEWDDFINPDDGKLAQPTFKFPLRKLGFDLFASAIENEEMFIHMTSGSCQGSRFRVAVNSWDDWVRNFYIRDENGRWKFVGRRPNTNSVKYPDTTNIEVDLIVYKDIETWGNNFVQPTSLRNPKPNDTFVITGITMPDSYFINAQTKLQTKGLSDLKDKNAEKFDYQFNLSNIFLQAYTEYYQYIDTNIKIRFKYNAVEYESFFDSISIQFGGVLPILDAKISDVIKPKNKSIIIKDFEVFSAFINSIVSSNIQKSLGNGIGIGISDRDTIMAQQKKQRLANSISNAFLQQVIKFDTLDERIIENSNELLQLSEKVDNIELSTFIFNGDTIVFNNITDITSLPIDSYGGGKSQYPIYLLDMINYDGITINALTFYDGGLGTPIPIGGYNIKLGSMPIGKRYFLEVNYGKDLGYCPAISYYQLIFNVNEKRFIIDVNGSEVNPITRIVFVNNGMFTETIVAHGTRVSSCEVDNDIRAEQSQQFSSNP